MDTQNTLSETEPYQHKRELERKILDAQTRLLAVWREWRFSPCRKPLALFAQIMLDSLFCLQIPERKSHIIAAPQGQAHLPEDHVQNPHRDAIEDINLCAESLVSFVIAALPNSISRHRALQLALDMQIR